MEMETEEYELKVGHDEERKIERIKVDESTNKIGSKIRIQIITSNETQLTNSIVIAFLICNKRKSMKQFLLD